MKIEIKKKQTSEYDQFGEVEWQKADMEHYGKKLDWKKEHFYLTVKENREVVGTLHFNIESGVTYIEGLLISSEYRGENIGTKLMLRAESIAKKNKTHVIYLKTGKGWIAEKFYKKLGYKQTGIYKNHYHHRDFIIFSKFF